MFRCQNRSEIERAEEQALADMRSSLVLSAKRLDCSVSVLFNLMYARYRLFSLPSTVRNFMALDFLLFPPILNPVIYGLMLKQVHGRL